MSGDDDGKKGAKNGFDPFFLELLCEFNKQRSDFLCEMRLLAKERSSERRWATASKILIWGIPMLVGLFFAMQALGITLGPLHDVVGVVYIRGEISDGNLASAKQVVPALEQAFKSPKVKAVIISIESPGGAPVESERIDRGVVQLKKRFPKPVIAVINGVGASAAYMTALHADKIVAGRYSLVGSIGAIIAPWQLDRAIAKLDISQKIYASGPLKSFLNPFSPVTKEADLKAQQLVNHVGETFLAQLKEARGARLKAGIDFGTGAVWSGVEAKELGLIDEIGTIEDVVQGRPELKEYNFGPHVNTFNQMGAVFTDSIVEAVSRLSLGEQATRLR